MSPVMIAASLALECISFYKRQQWKNLLRLLSWLCAITCLDIPIQGIRDTKRMLNELIKSNKQIFNSH